MTQTSALYRKRVRTNRVALMLSMMAMILGMSFLAWILVVLLYKGFGALSLSLFTQPTPAPDPRSPPPPGDRSEATPSEVPAT